MTTIEPGTLVTGAITEEVNGGFMVELHEYNIRGFLPGSHLGVRHPSRENAECYMHKSLDFQVLNMDPRGYNVVLSRRVLIEHANALVRTRLLAKMQEHPWAQGVVTKLMPHGALISFDGLEETLHLKEMSWNKIMDPSMVVQVGQSINVRLVKYNAEKEHFTLSLKQPRENVWSNFGATLVPGAVCLGKVKNVLDYGVFVEMAPGIEGLLHISQMGGIRLARDASVEVMVLNVDYEKFQMSLALPAKDPIAPVGIIAWGRSSLQKLFRANAI